MKKCIHSFAIVFLHAFLSVANAAPSLEILSPEVLARRVSNESSEGSSLPEVGVVGPIAVRLSSEFSKVYVLNKTEKKHLGDSIHFEMRDKFGEVSLLSCPSGAGSFGSGFIIVQNESKIFESFPMILSTIESGRYEIRAILRTRKCSEDIEIVTSDWVYLEIKWKDAPSTSEFKSE